MAAMKTGDLADDLTHPSVTMRDVAAHAGVPLSAVSLVLNDKPGVSDRRRQAILDSIRATGYVHAQRPRAQRTTTVGLVMEALSPAASKDGFMAQLVSGVEHGLRQRGLRMLLQLCRPGDDPLRELEELAPTGVAGVILANGGDVDESMVRRVLGSGLPVVLLENYVEASSDTHAVTADNFTAGHLSTTHLLSLGHRRIGMLLGSPRYVSLRDRMHGYQAALLDAGIQPDPTLMPPQISGESVKGYRQTLELLKLPDPPTAIYAVSDKSAFGAYGAIAQAGLRIPEDISVVGTDDVRASQMTTPPLTTFHVPTFDMGRAAASMMNALLHDEEEVMPSRTAILGSLVVRGSTRSIER